MIAPQFFDHKKLVKTILRYIKFLTQIPERLVIEHAQCFCQLERKLVDRRLSRVVFAREADVMLFHSASVDTHLHVFAVLAVLCLHLCRHCLVVV